MLVQTSSLVALLVSTVSGSPQNKVSDTNNELERSLLTAIQDFSQESYLHLSSKFKNENFVFSPLSLHSALSMVYLGSEPDSATYKELQLALGGLTNPQALKTEYNRYLDFLKKQNPVNYGNHIWLKEGYKAKTQFEEDVKYLNADIETLQFSSPGAADTVNGWVANITNGKIDKLVDSFDQDALLFIANALYFKDSWLYTFEDEDLSGNPITGGFSYLDGRKENIEMMQLTSSYIKYERFEIESLNGKAFEVVKIPYKNQKFQMKIMMPAGEPRDLMWLEHFTEMTFARDLRTEEDFNLFRTVNEEEFDGEVYLRMPKFKLSTKVQAKDMFQSMNVSRVFSQQAELGRISDDTPLGISSILHNSVIEVTKEGTEGAAATGIELVFFSASFAGEKEVIVDRPFIFVLEDTEHNIPLLVGRVVSPLV